MSSIWVLMANWLTSPWLFLSFSLIFLTIFLTSHRKPQHQLAQAPSLLDRVRSFNLSLYNFQQPDHANLDHPPTQLARSPSLLDFNLSSVYRSDLSVPEMDSRIHSEFSPITSSLAASPSPSIPRWDVFLSFRGEDTRKTFTAHLCAALRQKGIHTFMDDTLRSGLEISPALVKAIEESQISIIVLSKSYASSRWCLDELIRILECRTRKTGGQQVLPLFYDVDPSEVRHQTNSVGEAFAKLEKLFKNDVMKVKGWKKALKKVADLSGKHLGNRNEPEFIHEIIEWVNSILVKKTYFQVAKYPVGIEFRVQQVNSLLNIEKNDSRCMVGIFGTGGIGKTTLAKAIYNSIASQFECSCFLGDIRETSRQKGLIYLQNKLLRTLGSSSLMVDNVEQGITLIGQRLRYLRVLIVLDDVDQLIQLEKLGKADWFGLGSRIIITTRDKHLLRAHGVDSIYRVNKLDSNEALQLFSRHAFKSDEPHGNFVELTKYVIGYARGLPLALVVLGSDLSSKGLHEWKSALDRYKRIPNIKIHEILKISYDGLEDTVKEIFLDIACFFQGEEVGYVNKILDKCGFFPDYGIKVLVDKSLISIDEVERLISMHDLLQEVGREIVRQESPKEPGKRSRLWFHEDVRDVLEGNTGTNKVEGILINLLESDLMVHLSPKAFEKMRRLRLFISRNARFSEEPSFLSNELRLLDWSEYPGESFPSNFYGRNLVVLRMPHSSLKRLEGVQNFHNLTIMDFTKCEFLRNFPDVSRIPNLEKLRLDLCKNLVEVHDSVGFLDKLVELSFKACSNLISFPRSLKSRSLQSLYFGSCSSLKKFPEIECQMDYLVYIYCNFSGIEELPSSIGYAIGVESFCLYGCAIVSIPSWFNRFVGLKKLHLEDCKQLREILGLPPNVLEVNASRCVSLEIFLEEGRRSELFNKWDPPKPVAVKTIFPAHQSLEYLDLSGSAIVSLPTWFYTFVRLRLLYLRGCKQLREILGLPPSLIQLEATGCVSLEIFLEKGRRSRLINTGDPSEPVEVGTVFPAHQSLGYLDLSGSAIVSLPTWFNTFVRLWWLSLEDCKQLREIPELLPLSIEQVHAQGCTSLERFQFNTICDLPMRCVICTRLLNTLCTHTRERGPTPNVCTKCVQKACTNNERGPTPNVCTKCVQKSVYKYHLPLPMFRWIDLSDCPQHIRNDVQIHLFSEGHPKVHQFGCIFSGNKIPDCFSHRKEVANTNSFEININEAVYLDSKNTRFAFSAVIGFKEHVQNEDSFDIGIEVIIDGKQIYTHRSLSISNSTGSDHVWLHYHGSCCSQLKTDNLRVKFKCEDSYPRKPSDSVFFKSCGFHLQQLHEEKEIALMDGI